MRRIHHIRDSERVAQKKPRELFLSDRREMIEAFPSHLDRLSVGPFSFKEPLEPPAQKALRLKTECLFG